MPVVSHRRRVGTVVGGVSLAPSQQAANAALAGSLGLAVLVLVAVALITRTILARALRPVVAMTSTATEWSETAVDRRFNLGPPHDELTQLAATLDRLLDRIAETLRREQRLTAGISHELRTPLARVAAEAELALRRRHAERGTIFDPGQRGERCSREDRRSRTRPAPCAATGTSRGRGGGGPPLPRRRRVRRQAASRP